MKQRNARKPTARASIANTPEQLPIPGTDEIDGGHLTHLTVKWRARHEHQEESSPAKDDIAANRGD